MDGLTEGRIVHFVLPDNEHRPAIVVKVWGNDGVSNLCVFLDGTNDNLTMKNGNAMQTWQTSVPYSEQKVPGTWHWIERA